MIGTERIIVATGNSDILDSGTVISFRTEPVTFNFTGANLIVRFSFFNDTANATNRIEFRTITAQELEIQLYNFNNPLGTGNTAPLEIGNIDGRVLFLNFRVYFLQGEGNKTIHYTWYLQKNN